MQAPSSDVLTAPPAVEPTSATATQEGRKILAFIGDEQSETALRQGLVEFTSEIQIRRGNLRNAVKALEKEAPPRVLIVDVGGIDSPLQSL
jgi:pilus assembly protein CpaE